MRIFNSKQGSTFIEAALVFPLVIIIVLALIRIALLLYDNVYNESLEEIEKRFAEEILRARWCLL